MHLKKFLSAANKQRDTTCPITSSNRNQGTKQCNIWLQGSMDNLEAKHKKEFVEIDVSVEDEERFLKDYPDICSSEIDLTELDLHPPVAALMNLILEDPGEQLLACCRNWNIVNVKSCLTLMF